MNNINDFMICSKDIYPNSIPLTAGCIENHKDTFLDITIDENRFITKIYHKVGDFDFVVSFPFPISQTILLITHFILSWLYFHLCAQNLMILIFVVEIYWKVY